MNIPINKDFERDYKDSAWKGYSLRELKYLASGAAIAVLTVLFFWLELGIPVTAAIYIGVPMGAPVILTGFMKTKNGLSLWQNWKAARYRKATAVLFWEAGEYEPQLCREWQAGKKPVPAVSRKQKRAYRNYIRVHQRMENKRIREQKKQKKKAGKGERCNEL